MEGGAVTKKAASNTGEQLKVGGESSSGMEEEKFVAQLQALIESEKGPAVTAARLEYERHLVNAWKYSEFQQVLHLAAVAGVMEPLASYLESAKPLTQEDRRAHAGFIRSLEKQKPGRPRGRPTNDFYEAQRNAVRLGQQSWRAANNHQRVPARVTKKLISDAIAVASSAWPTVKISVEDVGRLVSKKQ